MRLILLTLSFCFIFFSFEVFAQEKDKSLPDGSYRIQKGDKLSVKFFSHPELNEPSVIVRPDGFISLQIIDDIRAEGRTALELKADLEKAYNETLLNPIISVAVIEFVAPRVFIGGQIKNAGRYDLRDAKTIVQVVFLAGGFTEDANRKMVILARPDGKGDWQTQAVNVMKILDKKSPEKDVELRDGDYIFIPDSKISQFNKAVETFRGLLPRFF
ncbi:MAG TPA: polysaccharide biosynthesis/export family protein [Pyrinomonadaceae bacterium]|nr:polysaccharide biosynthesis/export family protein [Pyrinomonadaceae bacterium]